MENNKEQSLILKVFPKIIIEKNKEIISLKESFKYKRILSILDTLIECGFNEDIELFNKLKEIYEKQFRFYKSNIDWYDNPWEIYNFNKLEDRYKFKVEIIDFIIETYSFLDVYYDKNIEYDAINNLFIEK